MLSFKLDSNGIEQITERAFVYYINNGAERKEALRTKLTIEEALLKFQENFDEDTVVEYNESKIFKQLKISLFIAGNRYNPFDIHETPNDILMDSLLATYNNAIPNWKYKNFVNQLDFVVFKEKKSTLYVKLLKAIGIGSILGIIARLLPGGIGATLATNYANPLSAAFAGLMCVMAVFLTFFAVSLGIVHAGDLSTLNTIGKTMLGRIAKIMLATTLITALVLIPFIPVGNLSLSSVSFKSVFDILIQFLPSNPIAPLVDFNTAQIIIVAAMFGVTMLILGSKTKTLEDVFTEGNIVAVTCNSFLNSTLIHIYVAVNFFSLFANSKASEYLKSIKMIAVILVAYAVVFLIYAIRASRKLNVNLKDYINILMPTFMINLSSASYGASFTTSIETLMNNGTDVDYAAMGHNVGGLLFKPAYAILLTTGTILSSVAYGVEFNLGYIVMIIILSLVLAMSLPTIPGAAISGFTLIFTQLALPGEGLALVLTLNALLDFFTVAVNGFCLQSEIFISANKAGKLNLDNFGKK